MSDFDISMLPGAQLALESVSTEAQLSVNVTELSLAIEVTPAGAPLVIVKEPAQIELVEVLLPGGGGPAPAYERRVDVVAEDVIYRAEAALGALEEAPAWRIRRITVDAAGEPLVAFAGGSQAFGFAWSDRLTYTYD